MSRNSHPCLRMSGTSQRTVSHGSVVHCSLAMPQLFCSQTLPYEKILATLFPPHADLVSLVLSRRRSFFRVDQFCLTSAPEWWILPAVPVLVSAEAVDAAQRVPTIRHFCKSSSDCEVSMFSYGKDSA